MLQKIINTLTSIIFPSYCYLCKSEGEPLCDICLSKRARAYDTPFPCITPLYSFKDKAIKKIIHSIKYFHRKDLIAPLARNLVQEITVPHLTSTIIIPIPMPKLRKSRNKHSCTKQRGTQISTSNNALTC